MVAGTLGSLNKAGSRKMTQISRTAGIDTSKAKLDVAVHGSVEHWQVDNTPAGWRRLAAELTGAEVMRAGIEASGGYECGVVGYLRAKGFTVLVLQPIQVKAYARLHLRRAKNDKLDAALIAACAAMTDRPRIEPDQRLAKLAQHLTFVEQIEEDIARFKIRLEHVGERRHRRMVVTDIARLKARRLVELARIAAALRAHDDLARRLDLVLSVPGIGERTAIALIVRMPEPGRVDEVVVNDSFAKAHGFAPGSRFSAILNGRNANIHDCIRSHFVITNIQQLASAADHAQRTEAGEAPWQAELAYWTGGDRPGG